MTQEPTESDNNNINTEWSFTNAFIIRRLLSRLLMNQVIYNFDHFCLEYF